MKRLLCALMSTTLLSAFAIFPSATTVTINQDTPSGVSQNVEFTHSVETSYIVEIKPDITITGTEGEEIQLITNFSGKIPSNKSLQVRSFPDAEAVEGDGETEYVMGDPSDDIDLYLEYDNSASPEYVRLTFNVENRGNEAGDTGTVANYIYNQEQGALENLLGALTASYSNTDGRSAGTYVGTTVFAMELVDYTA